MLKCPEMTEDNNERELKRNGKTIQSQKHSK